MINNSIMLLRRIGLWIGNKIAHSFLFGFLILGGIGCYLVTHYSAKTVTNHAEKWKIGYTHGEPIRYAFLKAVVEEAKFRGIEYELIPTNGTEETVKMISDEKIDFGLTTGGIEVSKTIHPHAREVMPLYVERLHLLVKNEVFAATSKNLWALKGHTVNLDGRFTGTHIVAWELLRFAGLIDTQNNMQFTPSYLAKEELLAAKDRRLLPDAIFYLGGVPSDTVQKIVSDFGYQLVGLPFQEAITLDHFKQLPPTSSEIDGTQSHLNKKFIYETSIPPFTYGIHPPVPHAMLNTFGTRLIFIARKSIDTSAVQHLIEVVLSPNISQLTSPPLKRDLLLSPFEFKPHPGVSKFLNADKHLTINDIFDFFQNVMQKWGLMLGIYLLAQQILQKAFKKKDTREKIEEYVQVVMEIEKELISIHGGDASSQIAGLRSRLHETRLKMMNAYINGNLINPQHLDHALKVIQMADKNLSPARSD